MVTDTKPAYPPFLAPGDELTDPVKAPVVVLPIPYEATTSYGHGTERGPAAILEASAQVEFFDEELDAEPCNQGIATHPALLNLPEEPERAIDEIEATCSQLLGGEKFILALGGEHSVSVGLVRAFKKIYPELRVLQLDAHSDLRDSYMGSKYNHACAMARIQELCPYVGIGVRSGVAGERQRLGPESNLFYAHEMRRLPDWQETVLQVLDGPLYITLDLDFFDPSTMPAVGTPEPGGFFWTDTLLFLEKVMQQRQVVGLDIVELAPITGFIAPDFFAAKLAYKLIGLAMKYQLGCL